ncbi:CPBP family intramembrane glutamic endopeptidase [Flammeovirga sp. EKP202]|uniref:CPBP family intramembrane glutamic endopeptidase n=1 Tax=Flammeovirga sp. EKP202 TaxID=2770592 RepID=UPI00165FCF71|nr:type II CAAX endopeptidase family protein [Flammeovirga sp. EKP202]MBD0403969.1 CPBP family intramembrane metalloprotease [Flammeovirga sp. EKP202]
MKSLLFYFITILLLLVCQQVILIPVLSLFKNFDLSFTITQLIVTILTILILIKNQWQKYIFIENVNFKKLFFYGLLTLIYVLSSHFLSYGNFNIFNFENRFSRFIGAVLLAHVFEEIIFRGAGIEYLKEKGHSKITRVIFTSICFGLVHTPFTKIGDIHFFVMGLISALIYEKERNLFYCIFFHAFYNLLHLL